MTQTQSKHRLLIALAMLSIAAWIIVSRFIPIQLPAPLSSTAVSAELARMMGFGMV